jgi:stage II sporulation protein R
MKKLNGILWILIFLILTGCNYVESKEIRIRILANSNSEADIIEKYQLRDALLEVFYEKSIVVNEDNLHIIKKELNEKIQSNYKIELKETIFPAKVLKGKVIPSGKYMTLLITIGEGKGKNWWSVLYPEFYGVNYDDSSEIEYRSFIYDLLNSN